MIEPMKKVTVLLHHGDREPFLSGLRDLGVVHVVEEPEVSSEALAAAVEEERRALRAAAVLRRLPRGGAAASAKPPVDAVDAIGRIEDIEARRERLGSERAALAKETAVLGPWGDFDPSVLDSLASRGLNLRFFEMPAKAFAALPAALAAMARVAHNTPCPLSTSPATSSQSPVFLPVPVFKPFL